MSILPINKETLRLGSSQAGVQRVRCDNEALNNIVDNHGKLLNLKKHVLGEDPIVELRTPIDLEGHVGTVGALLSSNVLHCF
jgi:hypothetical protein